jgi:hypothetical protein
MREKDDKVIAKISKAEKQELLDFANELDVPYSQLVREGVRLKIAELKETVPAERQLAIQE